MWNQKVSMQMIFLININVEFKIEYLLVVIIILVVLIDFIVKKRKTKATSEGIITNDTKIPNKEKLDTPRKRIVKRNVALIFIAIGIWGVLLQNMGFFDYLQKLHFHNGTLTTYSARRIHLNAKSNDEIDNMLKSYGFTPSEIFRMGSGKKVTEIIKFQDEEK